MAGKLNHPQLIADSVNGDRSALQKLLLGQYVQILEHIARQIPARMQSQLSAEDVIQQTVVQVVRHITDCAATNEASFRAWLKTIAENCLSDAFRRVASDKRGGRRYRIQTRESPQEDSIVDVIELLSAGSHTPSRSVVRHEAIAAVRASVEALPPDYRSAVELRFLQGKSLDETAAILGRSPRAVQGLVDRAKKKMRAALVGFAS